MNSKLKQLWSGLLIVSMLFGMFHIAINARVYADGGGGGEIYSENFNAFATGTYPGSMDGLVPKTGYMATVEELPDAGDKSLKIARSLANTSDSFYVNKTFPNQTGKKVIELKVNASRTDMIQYIPVLRGPSGAIAQLAFYSDGKIRVYAGGSWTSSAANLQSYAANTWYEIKLVMDTDTQKLDIYINQVLKAQQLSFQTSQTSLTQIQLGMYKGSTLGALYIDNIHLYDKPVVTGVPVGDLFSENFDTYTDGTYPLTLDTAAPVTGYAAAVKEIPDAADKSLRLARTAANAEVSFYVKKTLPSNLSRAAITFKAMASQTDVIGYIPMLRGPDNAIIQLAFYSDGNIRVYQNGSWTATGNSLLAYTPDTWYDIKVIVDAVEQKLDIHINGKLVKQQVSFQNAQSSISQLQFGIYKGSSLARFAINDLNIYAYKPMVSAAIEQQALHVAVGSSETMHVSLNPADALFNRIQWSSNDTQTIRVDQNGMVQALQAGTAVVTATVTDSIYASVYSAQATVSAYIQPATSIQLDTSAFVLPAGSDRKLSAEVFPTNATNKQVIWASDNTDVAVVDQSGKVTALSAGTTIIRATTVSGNISAASTLEVVDRQVQASYYISPDGSDSNPGTELLPFKTLEKARDMVRSLNSWMTGDINLYLRAGTHERLNTFLLDERDSGSQGYRIVYKAYPDEQPVLSGGKVITGWELSDVANNVYRAPSLGITTRQLYVDGVRAVRARSESGLANSVKTESGFTTTDTFLGGWGRISDLEMVFQQEWTQPRVGVDTIQLTGGLAQIQMKEPGWYAATHKGGTSISKGPVYYENAYELLDREGEWYLDQAAGYFYYKPRPMENMSSVQIVAPVLEELVKIEGSSLSAPVHDLHWEGVGFAYTTWMWPSSANGLSDAQNNHLRYPGSDDILPTAAVTVQRAHHIVFERNEFAKLGSTGLKLIGGVQDSLVKGNAFYDISGSAVNVGEPTNNNAAIYNPQDARLLMRNVDVTNNYIHDIGVDYASAAAISAGFPVNMEISHNQIFNIPYSAIHVGYGWYNYNTSVLKQARIQNNYIHDLMGAGIFDGGGIYTLGHTTGTMEEPNIVSGNYIQNQMDKYAVLYADNASDYWSFANNVIDLKETPVWQGVYASWAMGKESNLLFDNNYTTTGKYADPLGVQFPVTHTHVVPNANWSSAATAIIDASGLQEAYRNLADGTLERASLPKVVELGSNETYSLNVLATRSKGLPADLSNAVIYYQSSNENIAAVSQQGVITAGQTGKALITTHIRMGDVIRSLKTEVYVNDVLNMIKFKNVTGNGRNIILGEPLELETYGTTWLGHDVELEAVVYVSSDPAIAAVNPNGIITGLTEGTVALSVYGHYNGTTVQRTLTLEVIPYSSAEGLALTAYPINSELLDTDHWKVYGSASTLDFGDNSVTVGTPNGQATYEGTAFGNELLSFNMNIMANGGWEVIQFRNQQKESSLQDTYALVIKPDVIELQRFNNGQRTVIFGNVNGFTSIGGDAYSNDVLPFNQINYVQVGALTEENGVRIVLNINGENIFYFLDKEADRITEPGYLSIYAKYGQIVLIAEFVG
ncbi:Ig-like domain-containing protein [Paenibacillus sp. FSL H7-0331]|uniref:Ig-like domain-containing protein n=1 Tax=Paenibacillus sp. FSL H7-0331 TaxID=1920421 RepID=UPI00096F022C|nr:Ig-like domain-containing protein [Paenibacillus sp. FSL H7-0331]OMF10984.1 hypothetical protein BK127_25790 [Paenibacillus sp. FSL H7-0331]